MPWDGIERRSVTRRQEDDTNARLAVLEERVDTLRHTSEQVRTALYLLLVGVLVNFGHYLWM